MPAPDPDTRAHLEWLGFIQPNGLVVSAPALVKAGAILNRRDAEGQSRLAACVRERALDPEPCLPDFREFAAAVLDWGFSPRGYAGTEEAPVPTELEVPLPDYGETLRPCFAVRERDPRGDQPPWQLLVQVLDPGQDFDAPAATARGGSGSGPAAKPRLEASPHGRLERLLRGTGVFAGLLFNGVALRLVSAPRGESSGWMDFRVADMIRPAGRPLCSALRLLLSEQRLLAMQRSERLAALLADSRNYQNEVSERLSEQVMHALYELLRGLQAAHDASRGELLREPLSPPPDGDGDRDDVYRALLSVILRLVFLLYAEERGVLPEDETFARHYSLAGLYRRLREDAALHPDTMDQRFGAWAQLLVLFRLVHDGAPAHRTGGALSLPERSGALFDPDGFPFLEGRQASAGVRQTVAERVRPPLVSDGTVHRVLEKLFVLDGERISYRTLDVEQIGSVYETIMGFRMEVATGPSVAVKPAKKLGAPSTIDLEALLAEPAGARIDDGRSRLVATGFDSEDTHEHAQDRPRARLRKGAGGSNPVGMTEFRLGTRGSPLALLQARRVAEFLCASVPGMAVEIVPMRTSGDAMRDRRLADIGGKGLFAKELQSALLEGRIDAAVHSVKDMETDLPDGLRLAAVPERADPRDGLVGGAARIGALPRGARVGTASVRREAQLRRLRPDVSVSLLRGNVGTRLKRIAAGDFDATFLAVAGLSRLGLADRAEPPDPEEMLPAAGQGAIGVECRAGDAGTMGYLTPLDHAPSALCVTAERALLREVDGSCRTPIAALAVLEGGRLRLRARLLSPDGSHMGEVAREGTLGDAAALGADAGSALRADAPEGLLA